MKATDKQIEAGIAGYYDTVAKWKSVDVPHLNSFRIEPEVRSYANPETEETVTVFNYHTKEERDAKLRLLIVTGIVEAALGAKP